MNMHTKNTRRTTFAPILTLIIAAVFGLSACDGMVGVTEDGSARLRVKMIDAPFPFDLVESANVTISRVEVRPQGSGGPVTIFEETETFNLLELQNGVSALLGDVEVNPGTYKEVRLYVDDASIVLKDGTSFDLKVPSDRIKVLLDDLTVTAGEEVTLTIDFDVSKSFVVQGNPNTPAGIKGFIFKPTVVPAGIERRGGDDDEGDDEEDGDDDEVDGEDDEDELEVEGTIDVVGADFIEIDGTQYLVTDDTEFEGGDFASLEAGMVVEIEYVEAEDGTLIATKVEIEDGDDDDDEEEDEEEDDEEEDDEVDEEEEDTEEDDDA